MTEESINQRLAILVKALGMNIRSFSIRLGVNDGTTRNYIDRGSKPPADFIATVINSIEGINPNWLLLGKGEMFLPGTEGSVGTNTIKKNKGQAIGVNHGTATQNSYSTVADCEKERDAYKAERDLAQKEVVLLRDQLAMKDALIAAKDEMLTLLRGSHNRPN